MESLLLVVTVVSLLVALVMSTTAWRLVRDERRRSAARVVALSAAAGLESPPLPMSPAPELSLRATEPVPTAAGATSAPLRESFLGTAHAAPVGGGAQRTLALAAAILFVALATGLVWTMTNARGSSAAAVAASNTPLELLSLRHERQASKLEVSGLVRNPSSGRSVDHLSAVVFLFDRQGTFVTSARAPLDFVVLGLGDESPFVVTLDAPSSVTRYRVSFRTDQGLVPHVDLRGAPPIAASAEPSAAATLK